MVYSLNLMAIHYHMYIVISMHSCIKSDIEQYSSSKKQHFMLIKLLLYKQSSRDEMTFTNWFIHCNFHSLSIAAFSVFTKQIKVYFNCLIILVAEDDSLILFIEFHMIKICLRKYPKFSLKWKMHQIICVFMMWWKMVATKKNKNSKLWSRINHFDVNLSLA